MITIYETHGRALMEDNSIVPGTWIHACDPSEDEINKICTKLNVDENFMRAALDEEERSRIEVDNGQTLIIVDTPIVSAEGRSFVYSTLPFAIILTDNNIITVCLKETALTRAFSDGTVKSFSTKKKNKTTLQMLYKNATLFLFYLRQIDKASVRIENEMHISMQNKELVQMMGLEKSLVYFSTSLKGNEIVLERMLRMDFVQDYPEDTELLEDVIIENKQAIEMCTIYRDVINGTMGTFASIISNNLNMVMKLLASLTIIIALPSLVGALWGMNVPVPFENSPYGFTIVSGISLLITLVAVYIFKRKKWF